MINLEKIKPTAASAIIASLSVFFTIILSFFLLKRALFISLDIPRLIGICIGISSAILLLNAFIYGVFIDDNEEQNDENEVELWSATGFISALLTNTILVIAYTVRLNIQTYFWALIIAEIIFLIITIIASLRK